MTWSPTTKAWSLLELSCPTILWCWANKKFREALSLSTSSLHHFLAKWNCVCTPTQSVLSLHRKKVYAMTVGEKETQIVCGATETKFFENDPMARSCSVFIINSCWNRTHAHRLRDELWARANCQHVCSTVMNCASVLPGLQPEINWKKTDLCNALPVLSHFLSRCQPPTRIHQQMTPAVAKKKSWFWLSVASEDNVWKWLQTLAVRCWEIWGIETWAKRQFPNANIANEDVSVSDCATVQFGLSVVTQRKGTNSWSVVGGTLRYDWCYSGSDVAQINHVYAKLIPHWLPIS